MVFIAVDLIFVFSLDEHVGVSDVECVICMDRKAEVILPCSHMYCEQCFDEWSVKLSHFCPIVLLI